MSSTEKLLNRFLKNPGSIKFKRIETLLFRLRFEKSGINGSHHKFSHTLIHKAYSIPVHGNDCKTIYKKKLAKLISENLNIFQL